MDEYAKEIIQIPLLSNEETNNLIIAMQNKDEKARQKLIKHNLRLVLSIAFEFKKLINLPIEDLISIGSFGLIRAIDQFDISQNVKLSTYASPSIEHAFLAHIGHSKMQKRDDSNDISLQDAIYENKDGGSITLEDTIEDNGLPVDDVVLETIQNERLKHILKKITKKERELLFLRYGFNDGVCHTLEEVGQIQDVSKERIRQKEMQALKKLRHPRITRQLKDFLDE